MTRTGRQHAQEAHREALSAIPPGCLAERHQAAFSAFCLALPYRDRSFDPINLVPAHQTQFLIPQPGMPADKNSLEPSGLDRDTLPERPLLYMLCCSRIAPSLSRLSQIWRYGNPDPLSPTRRSTFLASRRPLLSRRRASGSNSAIERVT